ncbi:MAG: DUF3109 family protein [Flavobacteriia bacterium]|nr:DUF3109 family protein [Flavobacteriia bacterium]NBY41175.1 DUF3109 family protein [Flavobacteriia bacterium]
MLIELGDTIISSEIFTKKFVCDLNRCKGACCVLGDAGAPLTTAEAKKIQQNLAEIEPYMSEEGKMIVREKGVSYLDYENEPVTTLVNGKECAFVHFDSNQTALCAIESAYRDGKIDNLKPISCSLYPIRVRKYEQFTAVQFHEWDICSAAVECGIKCETPVYQFLKAPLIRAFGEEYFRALENIAPEIDKIK